MGFSNLVRLSVLIMTITAAKMGLVIVHTINAFKMLS